MVIIKFPKNPRKVLLKYRKIIILFFIIWALWFFGLGALGGWFLSKGVLEKFPEINQLDRILILAPHIDDEIISSGGLIQEAKKKAEVKIVYMTNGDDSLSAVIKEKKSLKVDPNDFVVLGQQRMEEGKKATTILGLTREDIFFLGYPDKGLYPMLNKFYSQNNPYTSQGTKFNYNPYQETYKSEQLYTGSDLVSDLEEIIRDFSPTIIIVPHPRDKNSDHRATYLFLEKVLSEKKINAKIFAYLVHYSLFPPRNLSSNAFLYPPKKLFSQKGWYSFNLSTEQKVKKIEAINQNVSQHEPRPFYDFLQGFVKRNEIFEEVE